MCELIDKQKCGVPILRVMLQVQAKFTILINLASSEQSQRIDKFALLQLQL